MKNYLFGLCCLFFLTVSCKKGEHDPFLSLKSRDNRIVDTWILKEMEISETSTMNGTYKTAFSNGVLTKTDNGDIVDQYQFAMVLDIKKDGSYSLSQLQTPGSELEYIATWNWVKSKKKKSGIQLLGNEYTDLALPFDIDRLSSKDLILTYSRKSTNYDYDKTVRMVFEKK